ncbi:hypothetical protein N8I74_06735 [Chitiniphilus purpureus]|uniref:Uncharacterized protein n=1 Tax=Chitiniphilus purpureus TaxID=2981137 RepID=A0ABY6DRQ5_9NEIS|nr:hypothetical protein [Chitiniphilus sp. CD1]UXY16712.1 hypothetical protein N8I74_06735 [Chitiniphilus sp. CD1]
MNPLIHGLESIVAGTTSFSAPPVESDAYNDFQAMAEALTEAKTAGLLYQVAVQRSRARATYDHAKTIVVSGGLTPKGREFLEAAKVPPPEAATPTPAGVEKPAEILQLKPTFAGMSIDLKALWQKWKSRGGTA